jgi:hypothetical protein
VLASVGLLFCSACDCSGNNQHTKPTPLQGGSAVALASDVDASEPVQAGAAGSMSASISTDAGAEPTVRIGYCTTMEPHAQRVRSRVPRVTLVRFASAAAALQGMAASQSEVTLVGRLARSSEKPVAIVEVRLGEGHTLIRRVGGFIEYASLQHVAVHTAANAEVAAALLPSGTSIHNHPSLDAAIREGLDSAVLINWNDIRDEHQLLIPTQNGAKVPAYRLPTMYHQRDLAAATVQELVTAFHQP